MELNDDEKFAAELVHRFGRPDGAGRGWGRESWGEEIEQFVIDNPIPEPKPGVTYRFGPDRAVCVGVVPCDGFLSVESRRYLFWDQARNEPRVARWENVKEDNPEEVSFIDPDLYDEAKVLARHDGVKARKREAGDAISEAVDRFGEAFWGTYLDDSGSARRPDDDDGYLSARQGG